MLLCAILLRVQRQFLSSTRTDSEHDIRQQQIARKYHIDISSTSEAPPCPKHGPAQSMHAFSTAFKRVFIVHEELDFDRDRAMSGNK